MTVRVVDDLASLGAELDGLGTRRALVLTTPGRRFLDRLELGERLAGVFDGAVVHVPREVVDRASEQLEELGADTLISLGGGSATGLAKALRMRHDVRFVAVPTTWSGSEMTRIWGVTADGRKQTGRDDRVRPDLVVHDPALFATLPRKLGVTSLLNALAHPIGALAGELDPALEAQGLEAVRLLAWALDELVIAPASADGRASALEGVRLGAGVLDRAATGAHHRVAHLLGGALGLDHSGLHAVLLPHTVRALPPARAAALAVATGSADLPAHLYDALVRVGAARSLLALGPDGTAATCAALAREHAELREPWVADALVGRRPSLRERRWSVGGHEVTVLGPELERATRVVVALHGRGADAGSVARMVEDLAGHAADVAIVAPQAPGGAWYPLPYRRSLAEHGDAVPAALARVDEVLAAVVARVGAGRTWLFGFSQGACLACEAFARTSLPLAGLVAPAGARIGAPGEHGPIARRLDDVPVLVGASREDQWLAADDVAATAEAFAAAGGDVRRIDGPGAAHVVSGLQRLAARDLLGTRPDEPELRGFGNTFESEALPGALPRHQNTPRPAPYGLHGEHVSGTGFAAPRAGNRKLWTYRIRPSAGGTPYERLPHATFVADWTDEPDPNLAGWGPVPAPEGPADFVDGLCTLGGAGHPGNRRGYAVHLYAANRSMDDRALCNADGDLLLVPWDGEVVLLTEAGALEVGPGRIALLPRGLRFSVLLRDPLARGWVAEVYGKHLELPERGPVGANGLADARHFRAPRAWFEDRLSPGYRIALKHGNALFQATQDHSPFDVVAWSGDHVPYVYDLMDFSPVMNGRVDHIDPSVHTVVHGALDEPGASALDFVLFAPRWDASEHTFRPPYFHRNVITEINGIVRDPSLDPKGPFRVGGSFLTPSFTPHGVRGRGVERALAGDDRASRVPDGSLWFQFESALPFHLTRYGQRTRIADWPSRWGAYRSHFVRP